VVVCVINFLVGAPLQCKLKLPNSNAISNETDVTVKNFKSSKGHVNANQYFLSVFTAYL
jgi:hypothetical protein